MTFKFIRSSPQLVELALLNLGTVSVKTLREAEVDVEPGALRTDSKIIKHYPAPAVLLKNIDRF